ncbi:unnamed protein product [Cyprideis torosa]|uniref:Uncharacterized protein n=1 Tax=Cyprideis torosa TaxID=163714 RepID=A0A7R8W3Q2_9CRUS|nr:unnamed protein product [Cyprideis torosa]CAG0883103.1 unnamed protein product [Cyprideis torosa]
MVHIEPRRMSGADVPSRERNVPGMRDLNRKRSFSPRSRPAVNHREDAKRPRIQETGGGTSRRAGRPRDDSSNAGSLICPFCDFSTDEREKYEAHLNRFSHRNKEEAALEKCSSEMKMMYDKVKVYFEEIISKTKNLHARKNLSRCGLCATYYPGTRDAHQQDEMHLTLCRFLKPTCSICDVRFQYRRSLIRHKCSLSHILKARKAAEKDRRKVSSGSVDVRDDKEKRTTVTKKSEEEGKPNPNDDSCGSPEGEEIDLSSMMVVDEVGDDEGSPVAMDKQTEKPGDENVTLHSQFSELNPQLLELTRKHPEFIEGIQKWIKRSLEPLNDEEKRMQCLEAMMEKLAEIDKDNSWNRDWEKMEPMSCRLKDQIPSARYQNQVGVMKAGDHEANLDEPRDGKEFIRETMGMYCEVCSMIFLPEDTDEHCSTKKHLDNVETERKRLNSFGENSRAPVSSCESEVIEVDAKNEVVLTDELVDSVREQIKQEVPDMIASAQKKGGQDETTMVPHGEIKKGETLARNSAVSGVGVVEADAKMQIKREKESPKAKETAKSINEHEEDGVNKIFDQKTASDYSDSRGVHGTRPPDGSQPQRDRPVESVAMHRVPDRRLFSDDGNCPSREVRRGGGHAGRATPPEARIKSLSDDDGLTTQLTNAIAAKVLNALTTSGLGVAAPVESLPRTRPAPASQFGRTQAGTRVWASDSRSKGVVELLDNSAGSTKSIPSAGGWSSRPVSTQRTGWSAESPPRTGWSAGATPRTGWSARTTPRTGWSAGATPRTGWSAGATPRTGWSAGATPRTGWNEGATPRTGWSAGATPRTGWSASATPRTGWSAGAANQSQGSGTSVLPTRLQHYGAAESRQVQSVKRLLGQTKNPLAVNDRSLPKKPGLTTPTKSVSFNSQKVSPKEKVPASEKPATTCESTPNGKQNKSVTPKKKGQVNGFSNEVDKSEIGEESRQESKQPEDQINVRMAAGASVAVGGKRGPSTDISLVEPKKKWFKSGVIDGKEKKREMDKQDQFKKDLEFLPAGYPLECRLCGYTTNQVEDFTAHLDTKFHQMSIEETLRADRIRLQRLVQASQVVEKKNQLLDAEKKQKADTTVQARKNGFYGKMVKEDGHAETEAKGNVHSEDQAKGENQEQ